MKDAGPITDPWMTLARMTVTAEVSINLTFVRLITNNKIYRFAL